MACKCIKIINYLEQFAPVSLSQSWDNSGLQLGDSEQMINKILVALDIIPEVVDEAVKVGADMIITHHPLIFKPLKNITKDSPIGSQIIKLIQNNICVYSAHTNLDIASEGVNYTLARLLGLREVEILEPVHAEKYKKIVVYVPVDHVAKVREAMTKAGAGFLDKYRDCCFVSKGTGIFRPMEGSKPYLGKVGELEHAEECKIETILPERALNAVVSAMLEVHPYEEVAYDIYNLENKNIELGFARIGKLEEKMDLVSFSATVKKILGVKKVKFVGGTDDMVKNVVVSSGAYSDLSRLAKEKGADVIVTGDLKYHDARDILDRGICAIDAGHFGTENVIVPVLVDYLEGLDEDIEIVKSKESKDIFMIL